MSGYFGGRHLCNRMWEPPIAKVVGGAQVQGTTVTLPPGCQPGDLAIFVGVANVSITAGPAGWATTSQGTPAQMATVPSAVFKGTWWKLLSQADIDAAVATFTATAGGTYVVQLMVMRGATTVFQSQQTTFNAKTSQAVTGIIKPPVGCKLVLMLISLAPTLAETVTGPPGFTQFFPGVTFAGCWYFCDPNAYKAGTTLTPAWTTSSGGAINMLTLK